MQITDRLSYLLMRDWDENERSGNTLDLNQDVFKDSRRNSGTYSLPTL